MRPKETQTASAPLAAAAVDRPPIPRLDSLTALRFFAAAFVALGHVETSGTYPAPVLDQVFSFPFAAVTFFFVLSGFVLVWSHRPGDTARGFYLRRFARVWPLYALITVLLLPIGWYIRYPGWNFGTYLVVWVCVLFAVQGLCPLPRVQEAVNPPNWSLSCEAVFYAVFPFVRAPLGRVRPDRLKYIATGLIVVCVAIWVFEGDAPWAYFFSGGKVEPMRYIPALAHLPEFLLGMVLAYQLRHRPRFAVRPIWALSAVAAWICVIALLHWGHPAWFPLSVDAFSELTAIPLSYLTIGAFASHELQGGHTVFTRRMLVRFGDWSYALYLVNLTVTHVVFMSLGGRSLGLWNIPMAVVLLAISVGISGLLHRFVERPAQRRLVRWYDRRRSS